MPGQPDYVNLNIDTTPVAAFDLDGIPSDHIISRSKGVTLKTTIKLGGSLMGLFGGQKYVTYFYAESLGPGGNVLLYQTAPTAFPTVPPPTTDVTTPMLKGAGLLAPDGLYRLTTVTTLTTAQCTAFATTGSVIEIAF